MKLSMMTYTMARQKFEVEDFVRTAATCKMEGIDWITTYGRDPKDLKNMSHDSGLEIACHTFFARKLLTGENNWLDEVKQSIEDAVIMEAPIVMIPTCSNKPDTTREAFQDLWISGLKQIAPLADDAGLILTIENFPGKLSAFVTADDYFRAKTEIPSLKLTYDDGNAFGGEDPVESFKRCADDVVHVHFKDWNVSDTPEEGYYEMLNGKYFKPALIGQGDVDTAGVWRALKEYGYKGFINIEYESSDIKADKAVRTAVEYLRSL
jgi:sugar phosphate isomerase/epimerase